MKKESMMTSEQLRIRISRGVEGTHVEISLDNEDQIGEAFELLIRLCENIRIQGLKLSLSQLWIGEKDSGKISETVSESTHRVALSLFRNWPNAKRVGDIQYETGLSQGYVSNILAGRQGDAGQWFNQKGDLWNLSRMGIAAIIEVISPTYLPTQNEGE